jgi:hypothetical protein
MGSPKKELYMSDPFQNAIETAIQNLSARQPKWRGRRDVLAPYVPALRALLAAGWSRTEIVAEIKACGARISPALLRDVLAIHADRPQKIAKGKPGKRSIQHNTLPPVPSAGSTRSPAGSRDAHDQQFAQGMTLPAVRYLDGAEPE